MAFPRVSVAMATFQGERFLEEQLDSILCQTLPPFELEIGDDGSDDDTVDIIKRFAARAPFPVRLQVNQRRLGHAENFLRTAERCSGDLIALSDQDDRWHSHKLATCIKPFADARVQVVSHDARIVDVAGHPMGARLGERPRDTMRPKAPLQVEYGLTMLFRRELAEYCHVWPLSVGGTVPNRTTPMGHDHWFYFLGTALGEVVTLDECLVDYRQHQANAAGAQAPVVLSGMTPEYRAQYWTDRAYAAKQRVPVLHALIQRTDHTKQAPVGEAISSHQAYITLCEHRALVYEGSRLSTRTAAVARIAVKGGYGRHHFGPKAIKSDALFGVLKVTGGPTLARAKNTIGKLLRRPAQNS